MLCAYSEVSLTAGPAGIWRNNSAEVCWMWIEQASLSVLCLSLGALTYISTQYYGGIAFTQNVTNFTIDSVYIYDSSAQVRLSRYALYLILTSCPLDLYT